MTDAPTRRKIRPEAVWAEARKAWEDGETARSVAKRYDVGVPALWKRPDPVYGPVEPAEGWDAFAARTYDAFESRLGEERDLAGALSAQRSNGLASMVARIRRDAETARAA